MSLDKQKSIYDGQDYIHRTTLGQHICFQRKDGSTSGEKLSDVKESHLLQMAEYALAMAGFNWWVPHTLKKSDVIITLVKKHSVKYLKHTHKFGIE